MRQTTSRRSAARMSPENYGLCGGEKCGRKGRSGKSALLAQTKSFHNLAIPIRVATIQIVQQPPALVDHHDQSAP